MANSTYGKWQPHRTLGKLKSTLHVEKYRGCCEQQGELADIGLLGKGLFSLDWSAG